MSASTTAPPSRGYQTRAADLVHDRPTIIDFWQRHLGDPAHRAAKFDWFYAGNPFGQAMIQLLHHDGTLIGCCGVAPRRMLWQGREIRAGLLADMAVDPGHRTLGPALLLQEALIDAANPYFDLLYGFPNHRSLPVVARLGYAALGETTRYSRVLRSTPYLKRRMPPWLAASAGVLLDATFTLRDTWRRPRHAARIATNWATATDARADVLWHTSNKATGLVTVRDSTLLRWRFDGCPLADTRYLLASEATNGRLLAWFACQATGSVVRVCDWWSANGVAGIEPVLAFALVHACRQGGYTSISLECATSVDHLDGLKAAGFAARESQPVIGKWLHDGNAIDLHAVGHLTTVDEDE